MRIFASWKKKIRLWECATEWIESQTNNVANAEFRPDVPGYPTRRLKARVGRWLDKGDAVNSYCLRADTHQKGGSLKIQQIKRFITRK